MSNRKKEACVFLLLLVALVAAHALDYRVTEPFFYNDETRHVMTGVYFRDVIADLPVSNFREYTVSYYLQYPALGLLVWPPFFYILEGLLMSVFGTSLVVPQMLVGLFGALGCAYLFLLARRTGDLSTATVATLIFGFSPLVFEYSQYVMLEVPTLAIALAAIYHFVRYLDAERRRDLMFAATFSALAALTRFDAVYLLPLFLISLAVRKRWDVLRRDPEFIVVEEMREASTLPAENQVRALLDSRTDRFRIEKDITIESNDPKRDGHQLKVFRNLLRNNDPQRRLSIELLMLQRSIETSVSP